MRMEQKNLQVYLEEYKYKIKKIKITKFINTKLESDPVSELEPRTGLESKSEPESNSK